MAFYLDVSKCTALGQLVSGMVRMAERAWSGLAMQQQAGGAAAAAADDEPAKAAVLASLSSNCMAAPAALGPSSSRKLLLPDSCGAAHPVVAAQRASRLHPPRSR